MFYNCYSILHVVVGVDHMSSFPLLVNKVCEGFQLCIEKKSLMISLHHNGTELSGYSKYNYELIVDFLTSMNISYTSTLFLFTSNNKMMHSLQLLNERVNNNTYIYHTDIDEFVDMYSFRKAMDDIRNKKCNYY